ncbi:hypothetical protein [Shimwellia blattae]|uniref:Uncharacterized protein n=1 Tax=Shimwellia blattae (strain ATCC 29907 / DSM 4481 / JCM 1650 / NBRC 105725 / CDC 9005-74) TaxID=630626 RepID=I2B9T2_SHIBC|nr:hypothetical protein [Shimwellia blattae]AFJ47286.1 hypothetical protein EBL_c21950 [Shimwellia blattae DSM 4481 = NBRC 105725]GAB80521.1 hypothetical protein EB105725_05_02490 [Shimwellia blattae DSM 4481 = NBRC 105725]VDY64776.1 Uncharacterised protein [Shimwellia blattae]VEC22875.1 Uncharacterised protein [Shimwellia blattae]
MTSKLTRDELNDVVATYGKSHVAHRMAAELLAAMDSEPVALRWRRDDSDARWTYASARKMPEFIAAGFTKENGVDIEYLYAAQQSAPVVPEEKPMPNTLSMYAVDAVAAIAEVRGWNACRAAMLAGNEPVSRAYKLGQADITGHNG